MLHAVDHDRLVGAVGERHDRFHAQQIVAAHRRQPVEPGRQRRPGNRLVAGDAEGADAVVVAVRVGVFVRLGMVVVIGEGLVTQPALYVDALRLRIEEAEVEEQHRIDGACPRRAEAAPTG